MLIDLIDALGSAALPTESDSVAEAVEISSVDYDSRRVGPGSLFCCLPGLVADGHDFVDDAIDGGAVALLSERSLPVDVPDLVVPDAREAMGQAAALLNGRPSERLDVIGITGTNGKTTVAHVVEQLAGGLGCEAAVIGTLTGERTTPESPDVQARLAELHSSGTGLVAMEVSSHALDMRRVAGTRFRSAVFTNLSPEHLDYHGDMEQYFAAKARLFTSEFADSAIINVDDEYGRRLAVLSDVPVVETRQSDLDLVEVGLASSRFAWRGIDVRLSLGGLFNIGNAVLAAEVMRSLGYEPTEIARALTEVSPVPGRFERVDAGQEFEMIVDYAHTPDGLAQLLDTIGESIGEGRLLVVFGCGGERDRSKRPLMGSVVAERADRAWLTSDNPRREDPEAIIAEVFAGMGNNSNVVTLPDRRDAIAAAVGEADDQDVVVIAGKGHEMVQTIGMVPVPFDDREVAREAVAVRLGSPEVGRS